MRTLYTIALVTPDVAAELQHLRQTRHDDWWAGAGEQLLASRVAAPIPLVAAYRVVLDGWDRALNFLDPPLRHPLRKARALLDRDGLAIITPGRVFPALTLPRKRMPNSYAIRALAHALNDAAVMMPSIKCPMVILCRTLYASFADTEFTTATRARNQAPSPHAAAAANA